MAGVRAHAVSSSISRCAYHVFLSFRGEDTRKNFTDHLYTALMNAGFHTFRDGDDIKRGENIELELQRAIEQSRMSIVVFSKNYASSGWCLDELVRILQHKKASMHKVLPVFYDVDPSTVRSQIGSLEKAFARHEERFEAGTVEGWRAALREVAALGGMVLADGHESKCIQNIVKEIGSELKCNILSVALYPVGLDSRVKTMNLWLEDGSNDSSIAVICGMGGIGKTTIARIVYNLNIAKFEGGSFVANISKSSEEPNGLVRMQKQVLSDILKGKKEKIYSVDEGKSTIKRAICCKRVLLVLDDVGTLEQLKAILGMKDWLYPGSKIIITTRHENLLKQPHEVDKIYRVSPLNHSESLELFCWHAFGKDHPIEGYENHSKRVVCHSGGLPLALQVLGSSLYGKGIDVWESQLQKLELIPDNQILKILKISYDSLPDDHDRDLFLDIACFFVGKEKDYTVKILDGFDFHATVGIENLVDRCLLAIGPSNELLMHQLIRDMGREIIRQESPKESGKRSRLWHQKDVLDVLRGKTGTETIEGLILDQPMLLEQVNSRKRRRFDLETDAFSRMHNLRLLQLNYVQLIGGYEKFPKKLGWLCWHGFTLKSIPKKIQLENLVALEMHYSSLEQVWKGTKVLKSLKILDLSHSHLLTKTPNFSEVPSLERLMLEDCISLVDVHESIGDLERLVFLNLKGCKNLRKLPIGKIGKLKSLKELILSGCSKLDIMPEKLRNHAEGTASTTKSWHSNLWSWVSLKGNPASISFSLASLPNSLVSLDLANCNLSDDAIPSDLSVLPSLEYLDLSRNPISSLPESIKALRLLYSLHLNHCQSLLSLPELPTNLLDLDANNCISLERTGCVPKFSCTGSMRFLGCSNLVEVQGSFKLEPITRFDTETMKEMGLVNLESIQDIDVELVNNLTQTQRKSPLQVLYECGISSIFLHGSEIPGWFSYKSRGLSISFYVPGDREIRGLNVSMVYASFCHFPDWSHIHYVEVKNKTTGLQWKYRPTFCGVPGADKDMLWLSHWKFGNQELKGGDQVNVSALLAPGDAAKMFGVHLAYEQEETGFQSTVKDIMARKIPCHQYEIGVNPYQQVQKNGNVTVFSFVPLLEIRKWPRLLNSV